MKIITPLGCLLIGQRVRTTEGLIWQGRIVGYYSTALTKVGYCVESEREPGSVQIYPAGALAWIGEPGLVELADTAKYAQHGREG